MGDDEVEAENEFTTFNNEDEYMRKIPQGLFANYKINKDQVIDLEQFLKTNPRPATLPKGEYTITASAEYTLQEDNGEESKQKLSTDLQITIR